MTVECLIYFLKMKIPLAKLGDGRVTYDSHSFDTRIGELASAKRKTLPSCRKAVPFGILDKIIYIFPALRCLITLSLLFLVCFVNI